MVIEYFSMRHHCHSLMVMEFLHCSAQFLRMERILNHCHFCDKVNQDKLERKIKVLIKRGICYGLVLYLSYSRLRAMVVQRFHGTLFYFWRIWQSLRMHPIFHCLLRFHWSTIQRLRQQQRVIDLLILCGINYFLVLYLFYFHLRAMAVQRFHETLFYFWRIWQSLRMRPIFHYLHHYHWSTMLRQHQLQREIKVLI